MDAVPRSTLRRISRLPIQTSPTRLGAAGEVVMAPSGSFCCGPFNVVVLVLLCHCLECATCGWRQHGQRGRALTRPAMRCWRRVLIESGTCGSGRIGGAARREAFG